MIIVTYPLPNVKKYDLKGCIIMEDMHNTELGLRLGYLNNKQEVTNSGMQALVINLCADMSTEDVKPIDVLNSEIESCFALMDKSEFKKPVTLADFRNIAYNIALGVFPAYPDERIYLIFANALLDYLGKQRKIVFSEMRREYVPILRTQIEQEREEMAMLQERFDNLFQIVRKGEGAPYSVIMGFYDYYELFSPFQSETIRSSYLYDMGYIQGKRDERARRKKAAEKAQV